MFRNAFIVAAVVVWFALVVVLALARCWSAVTPLLALAGMVETFAHEALGARLDAKESHS
jgi:hypothetical protein